MKGITVILIAIFALGQASSEADSSDGLDAAFMQIGSALAKQIQSQLGNAILGKNNVKTLEAEAGIPLLPNPVYIKGNLNTAVLHGLGDLVPEVKLDIIRRTLDVKYTIPAARIEGDYNLALSAAEDFESLIIARNHYYWVENPEPFIGWYLHKELVSLEEGAHEPLVDFIIGVIDKILCPICQ